MNPLDDFHIGIWRGHKRWHDLVLYASQKKKLCRIALHCGFFCICQFHLSELWTMHWLFTSSMGVRKADGWTKCIRPICMACINSEIGSFSRTVCGHAKSVGDVWFAHLPMLFLLVESNASLKNHSNMQFFFNFSSIGANGEKKTHSISQNRKSPSCYDCVWVCLCVQTTTAAAAMVKKCVSTSGWTAWIVCNAIRSSSSFGYASGENWKSTHRLNWHKVFTTGHIRTEHTKSRKKAVGSLDYNADAIDSSNKHFDRGLFFSSNNNIEQTVITVTTGGKSLCQAVKIRLNAYGNG